MGRNGVWLCLAGILLLGHTAVMAKPYLGKEPRRVASQVKLTATAPRPIPAMVHLRPSTSPALAVIKPRAENLGPSSRYLVRLLTKLGYHYHPPVLACSVSQRTEGSHPECASSKAPRVVAKAWGNLPKYAQGQRFVARVRNAFGHAQVSKPCIYSFPVAGPFSFRDSWGERRSRGRCHRAVDIFAPEGTAVYAMTAGVVKTLATFPEAGITLLMQGQDGRGYGYMHLQRYARGLVAGKTVKTGEVIGYLGHTGVQHSAAHLHFQVYADHRLCRDGLLNPYPFLVRLCRGVGVTDLYRVRLARSEGSQIKGNRVRVRRHPVLMIYGTRPTRAPSGPDSSICVVKNY